MYQALYRKYRPQVFDDVVGQTPITTTLRSQVENHKLSHAYLFTGTHGTGKTTCAKILAKAVNCEHPIGGNPCNQCATCRGIDLGNIMDVQEIDAASNNGVDNVRTIREEVIYPPAEAKMRVYIIDEVHMLSTSAFNALLKTIEEPPEYLMFILATTEVQKIPATILSRCQRYSFRRASAEDIASRIRYVAYQEGISIDEEAADLLSRLASGAFRDGLSLLDQCASASGDHITVESVYQTLGLAAEQETSDMMLAIAAGNTAELLSRFSGLYSQGKDAASMLDELSALARDILIMKTAPNSGLGMISSVCTASSLKQMESVFTAEELLRMIDRITETTNGLKTSLNQRLEAELCLIHLCSPDYELSSQDLSAKISRIDESLTIRIQKLEEQLRSGVVVVSGNAASSDQEAPAEVAAAEDITPAADAQIAEDADADKDYAFVTELVQAVTSDLQSSQDMHLLMIASGIKGYLKGNTINLSLGFPDYQSFNESLKDMIIQKASFKLKRSVRLNVIGSSQTYVDDEDDRFDSLMNELNDKHYDNIKIQ